MKKILLIAFYLPFLACNDGDLQIETVDFDSITTVQSCETLTPNTATALFKINGNEALILELPNSVLKNEISNGFIESAVPGNSQVTYRIFSETVTTAYFCDAVPPLTPTVSEEIEAKDGAIFITTTSEDGVTFSHTISLSGISFVNNDGSRITDLQISEFGTVTTTN